MAGLEIVFTPENAIEITRSISVFEILSILGIVVALVSLGLTVGASVLRTRTLRAEFSFKLWEAFSRDLRRMFNDIDYGRFTYPPFTSPEVEQDVDALLYFLDEIALLIEQKVLPKSERERWRFRAIRVLHSSAIGEYLEFLDGLYRAHGKLHQPHAAARRVFHRAV